LKCAAGAIVVDCRASYEKLIAELGLRSQVGKGAGDTNTKAKEAARKQQKK
jgi:hypothetical protein